MKSSLSFINLSINLTTSSSIFSFPILISLPLLARINASSIPSLAIFPSLTNSKTLIIASSLIISPFFDFKLGNVCSSNREIVLGY